MYRNSLYTNGFLSTTPLTYYTSYKIHTIYYFTGNEEPTPGMSYIEFDINKHTTDLLGLYRYVAAKVHRHHFVGGWAGLEIPR